MKTQPNLTKKRIIPDEKFKLFVSLQKHYKDIDENDKKSSTNLSFYEKEHFFGKKDFFNFEYEFRTNQTFKDVKKIIQEKTNFFPEMMEFAIFSHNEKDKKGKIKTFYTRKDYKDDEFLYDSYYYKNKEQEAKVLYVLIKKNEKYDALNKLSKEMKEENQKMI